MAGTQGIRLEEDIQHRLKLLAERRDRSMNYLIKKAVSSYLETEERYEKEKQEDQERLQHFLDTGEHISHAAMRTTLKKLLSKAKKAASV